MIALSTSAMVKRHMNVRLSPRETVNSLSPYVAMRVPFAASRKRVFDFVLSEAYAEGKTEISAPESIRNFICVSLSVIVRRFCRFGLVIQLCLVLRRLYGCVIAEVVFWMERVTLHTLSSFFAVLVACVLRALRAIF